MSTTSFPNLASDLRKWGLTVKEVEGWQHRSANWSRSFAPIGIVCHHTAGPISGGNTASLHVVVNGRPGLSGPLAQLFLARDGSVYVVSGHRANHAGLGGTYKRIPKDSANTYAWGIEAENNGTGEKWTEAQLKAYYRLCAALLTISGNKDVSYAFGHKEWTTRKVDPAGITMAVFRKNVEAALQDGPVKDKPVEPKLPAKNPYASLVDNLQRLLEIDDDGVWGPNTDNSIRRMRQAARVGKGFSVRKAQAVIDTTVDGDWGPKSRAALAKWLKDVQKLFGVPQTGKWDSATESFYQKFRKASIK